MAGALFPLVKFYFTFLFLTANFTYVQKEKVGTAIHGGEEECI
jgi:hypothetical protein